MCWNKEASLTLGIIGALFTLDQFRRYRSGQCKYLSVTLVYALYTSMELFQFAQYVHGFASCDSVNTQLTFIAHILLWIQPIALNYHSFVSCKKQDRSLFRFSLTAAVITALISSLSLYIGYQKSLQGTFPSTNEDLNNVGPELCTKADPIHFSWFFPYDSLQGYRPLGYSWLLVAISPHFFASSNKIDPKNWFGCGKTFGLHALAGWVVAALILRTLSTPLWSYWCLTSMCYLISPYFIWYVMAPFFPKSFFETPEQELPDQEESVKKKS